MSSTQCLDHLVLFLPVDPDTKLPQLPDFIQNNFTITPGGFHADGATSNTLIALADGCYIELISFIAMANVSSHWWGPDAAFAGWKDWCLTNSKSPEENHDSVMETHAEPQHGGRKRTDGVQVKWAVTFPKGEKGGQSVRGRVPFFCHDITPRDLRVPRSHERTSHPCGALGVRQITVIVKDQELLDQTRHAYTIVLGQEGHQSGDKVMFNVGRVHDVDSLGSGAKIMLRRPANEKEMGAIAQSGYCYGDVVLGTRAGPRNPSGTRTRLDDGEEDVRGLWLEYL